MAMLVWESLASTLHVIHNSGTEATAGLRGFVKEEDFCFCLHSDVDAFFFYNFSLSFKH